MIDCQRLLDESFLRHIEWHEEIDSTNTYALNLARQPLIDLPCLIGANRQHAGRGRGTNRWWSSTGTLMFSVLLNMNELRVPQHIWPQFSMVTGIAVAETLEVFLPRATVGLKWPNDVWLGGRKVCGILIEQPEQASGRLVVGLGWNVNTSFSTAPSELRMIATSMVDEFGGRVPEDEVLLCFLQRWEQCIGLVADSDFPLVERWARFCVLRDRLVRLTAGESEHFGRCHGIANDGSLLLSDQVGTRRFSAGTVRLAD